MSVQPSEIRRRIATEAARLLVRGKVGDYSTARKRAARWLKRKGLARSDMPSHAEIQDQIFALSGVFDAERDGSRTRLACRHALDLFRAIDLPELRLIDGVDQEGTADGFVLRFLLPTGLEIAALSRLAQGDIEPVGNVDPRQQPLIIQGSRPCKWQLEFQDGPFPGAALTEDQVANMLPDEVDSAVFDPEHPEIYDALESIVRPLDRIRLDRETHPEGDALYHTLQVFEAGRNALPYDQEFLLACLLHDAGLAIDRHAPMIALLDTLGQLITDRTRFLLLSLPNAHEYLRTGSAPRSLRKSEDFDEAVLLARCDRAGRVCGAEVCSLAEAFDYIASLDAVWDDEEQST